MDRVVTFALGPLSVRAREVLEGFDDRVRVDLPHLHAEMVDISYSINAISGFRTALEELLQGAGQARLDLSYSEGAYGLLAIVAPDGDGRFAAHAILSPDIVDSATYAVDFGLSGAALHQAISEMSSIRHD